MENKAPGHQFPPSTSARLPRIDFITSSCGTLDAYIPGDEFAICGEGFLDLSEVPNDTGVYLVPAEGGPPVRVFVYHGWTDKSVRGVWPIVPSLAVRVILEVRGDDGIIRSATYARTLALGPRR